MLMIVKEKKRLYPFQEQAVNDLIARRKHILYATTGVGKNPISVVWAAKTAERAGKHKILVLSTPSKVRTEDHLADFQDFCPESKAEMELVSWFQLHKWVERHKSSLEDYVVIADEIHKAKGGASSRIGRSFLKLVKGNSDWCGFTATPGDRYIDLYAYFQASGRVKNKTEFVRRFCNVQTFKGFPEIVGYREEETLKRWWSEISLAPDAKEVLAELPPETHKVVYFRKPALYTKILKERNDANGEPIETPGKLIAELRKTCFSKEKQQWLADFLEGAGEPCLLFYQYTATGDLAETIAKKALLKGARVWRIDGRHHEIPTKDTIGKRDVIICQWQSGAEGINFQYLRLWVSLELTYSYTVAFQARGRIKRIGQKRNMHFYYLQTEHTIEEAVMKALHDKSEFAADVWALGQGIIEDIKDFK